MIGQASQFFDHFLIQRERLFLQRKRILRSFRRLIGAIRDRKRYQ
jgi:hypothetical protein